MNSFLRLAQLLKNEANWSNWWFWVHILPCSAAEIINLPILCHSVITCSLIGTHVGLLNKLVLMSDFMIRAIMIYIIMYVKHTSDRSLCVVVKKYECCIDRFYHFWYRKKCMWIKSSTSSWEKKWIVIWSMPDNVLAMWHNETRYHRVWYWLISRRVFGAQHQQINKLKHRNPHMPTYTVDWIIIDVSYYFLPKYCLVIIWTSDDLFQCRPFCPFCASPKRVKRIYENIEDTK